MEKCPKDRQNHNRPQWGNVQSTDRTTTGREKTKEKEDRNMKEQRGKDSERVQRRKQLQEEKKRKQTQRTELIGEAQNVRKLNRAF